MPKRRRGRRGAACRTTASAPRDGSATVACAGKAALDQVWHLQALPETPGKYIAGGMRMTGGGMAATAGAAIAPGGRTPNSAVLVDPEGERMLAVFPGAGLPADASIPPALVSAAGGALADPRWIEGAERLFALAAATGCPRILDADIAAPKTLRRLARQADHLIFSQRGLEAFSGCAGPAEGLAIAAATGAEVVAVTLGAAGSLWWEGGAARHLPAPRVQARDTTGCGDVFHGACALAVAEGMPTAPAARFATVAAALKAAHGDGWDGMPDRAAVAALLSRGWD